MKISALLACLTFVLMAHLSWGQPFIEPDVPKSFDQQAAIYLDNDLFLSAKSKNRPTINLDAKGKIRIFTVNFSFKNPIPYDQVAFKVAIHNTKTNTIWMYSENTYTQISLEEILSKCEFSDNILLITVDKRYSLPMNELVLNWGC